MKRISLLAIATLMAISTATIGYSQHRVPARYQTRYSPYAFGKDNCGLVPYYLRYSPYARSANHSGLVPYWVRYCPYAFSNKHSGLISDYGYGYCYSQHINPPCDCDCNCRAGDCNTGYNESNSFSGMTGRYEEKVAAHRQEVKQLENSRREIKKIRQKDDDEIICRYLRSKDVGDYQIARAIKINNKTAGVEFLLRDKNLIIKYRNPDVIESLAQQPQYKRNYYDRYRQESEEFCKRYEQAGGKVYEIVSSNERQILAQLKLCNELNSD
jgi:hypothetical protein